MGKSFMAANHLLWSVLQLFEGVQAQAGLQGHEHVKLAVGGHNLTHNP